jgi:hypothetical protein
MGKKKSIELPWLYKHLTIQYSVFFIGLIFFIGPVNALLFSVWNIVAHGIIDWNIWKLYKLSVYKRLVAEANEFKNISLKEKEAWIVESGKNWQYWEDHWFYATIGFDQLLHAITIILLFMFFL